MIQDPLNVSWWLRTRFIFQRPEGALAPPHARGPYLPGHDCDVTENWHLQLEVHGRGKKIPCFSQEDERESQSIFFLSILLPQIFDIKDLSVSDSFIHDHFNLSCHLIFPGLFQLSPHQSPCLYSSSYIQIPFPSDFFFDHESFRRALTFPRTWKIGRFFFPLSFCFLVSLHCIERKWAVWYWSVSISQGVLVASYAITFWKCSMYA